MFQKIFGSKKVYGQEGGKGDYPNFPSKPFCLTVPKHFVEEPFCAVLENFSGGEKVYGKERGGAYRNFPSKIFCLKVPKHFVGETLSLSLVSGIEKFFASEGYVTIFRRNFFCLTVPKHFVEEPISAVFQKNSSGERVYGNEGGRGEDQYFPSETFCLKVTKNSVGESFSLSSISGIEKNYASEGYITIFRRKVFVSQ